MSFHVPHNPYFLPLVAIGISGSVLAFGLYLNDRIDSAIDYDILHQQIMTNQTFVDEMDCDKVILTHDILDQVNSPNQQDEVIQLRADFDQLIIDKKCEVDEVQK